MSTSIVQVSGTLLKASPPMMRARLIDGRSNRSEDSRLKGSVSMRRKASWALRIALSPSHGVEPCAAVPLTCTRTASTPLAWTPMCRSVGSPVSAKSAAQALGHERVGRAVADVLGLLVGHAHEAHADRVLGGDVRQRAHDRRERALHVVGAAADEPVALDAGRELAVAGRDDVEVAVEDDARAVLRSDVGQHDGQPVELALGHVDRLRLQPAADEGGRRAQALGRRGVVRDQALGQDPLVHGRTG